MRIRTIGVMAALLWSCASGDENTGIDVPGLVNAGTGVTAGVGQAAGTAALAGTPAAGVAAPVAGVAAAAGVAAPVAGVAAAAGIEAAAGVAPVAGFEAAAGVEAVAGIEAAAGAAAAGTGPTAGTGAPGALCLQQGGGDYSKAGPYQVGTMDVQIPGAPNPAYTLFYPMPLETGCLHPITAWGNGTSVSGSGTYAHYGRNVASWGILMIASHDPNVGSGEFHKAGLDWLLEQNDDPGSMFYQKLSPRAGVSGHSQGGIGASAASDHPNVEAEVCVQGGGFPAAGVAFICLTGTDDFVRGPCVSAYNAASGPSFLADHSMADHIGTPTPLGVTTAAGSQYIRLMNVWFRCYLADDQAACSEVAGGASSPVCGDSGWATCEGSGL